jgi:hypothetical protein
MSLKLTIGDLTIHRIIEQETTFLPALDMLPGLTPELLAENRPWMQKASAIDADDVLILCFQSYIVKTPITPFWSTAASATTNRGRCARNGT